MRFSVAVFDLDGTILNTLDDLTDALNVGLAARGFPPRTVEETRNMVGNGMRKLIERGVPAGTSDADTEAVFAAFTAHYALHCADKTRPYEGAVELLTALRERGVKTAVVSNKSQAGVDALVARYFPGLFDVAIGERAGIARKPAPDGVFEALRALGTNAVYIGDSEVDYQTSRNASLPCISVTWGFRDRDFVASFGADTFADTPAGVLRLME